MENKGDTHVDIIAYSSLQKAYILGQDTNFDLHVHPHLYLEFELDIVNIDNLRSAINLLFERHPILSAKNYNSDSFYIQSKDYLAEIPTLSLKGHEDTSLKSQLLALREKLFRQDTNNTNRSNIEVHVTKTDSKDIIHLNISLLYLDGTSVRTLLKELSELYINPSSNVKYKPFDFESQERFVAERKLTKRYQKTEKYWSERLTTMAGAPILPTTNKTNDGPKRSHLTRRKHIIKKQEWESIEALARDNGTTAANLIFTAYNLVIAHWSKKKRFSITIMVQNRDISDINTDGVLHNFASTVLIESDLASNDSFLTLSKKLERQVFRDVSHSAKCGLEVLQERNRALGNSLSASSPVVFVNMIKDHVNDCLFQLEGRNCRYSAIETPQVTLDHQAVSRPDGGVSLVWDVSEDSYTPGVIDKMFEQYRSLVSDIPNILKKSPQEIDIRSASEKVQHQRYNQSHTTFTPRVLSTYLYDTLERVDPNKTLIINEGVSLSYKEFANLSNRLAWHLRETYNIKPNDNIAILMTKGWEQIVAAQAIIASGGTYIPIDANLPQERKENILTRCNCRVALTQAEHVTDAALNKIDIATIIVDQTTHYHQNSNELDPIQTPDDNAYIIFTSGSTGEPKGVVLNNYGPANTIDDVSRRFNISESDIFIAISALNFDLSVYDIFGAISVGATLIIPPEHANHDPSITLALAEKYDVTVWNSVPAIAHLLTQYLDGIKYRKTLPIKTFMLSGDWIPLSLPNSLRSYADCNVISMGGATEASIWSNYYTVDVVEDEWKSIPYGYPLSNQQLYILDETYCERPDNVPGEIFIGGDGVAKGYWKDGERTEKAFIENVEICQEDGTTRPLCLYRTGDWGVRRPEGFIEFLGREDTQVKIRGYRIELGEIESTLEMHNDVKRAVVKTHKINNETVLIGFIQTSNTRMHEQVIKTHIASHLPSYMVPHSIEFRAEFPLGRTGKIDRKSLKPTLDVSHTNETMDILVDPIQIKLANIWKEILVCESNITPNCHFFDLGGTSFSALALTFKINEQFNIQVAASDIFNHSTLKALSLLVTEKQGMNNDISTSQNILTPVGSSQADTPFYWFHPSGGNILCYQELASLLSDKYTIVGIQSPDYDQFNISSFEELVELYVDVIIDNDKSGVYRLGGWSMGGVLAHAAAHEMKKRGYKIQKLVLIDAPTPQPRHAISNTEMIKWFISDLAETDHLIELDTLSTHKHQPIKKLLEIAVNEASEKGFIDNHFTRGVDFLFQTFRKNIELLHEYKAEKIKLDETSVIYINASINEEARVSGDAKNNWFDILPVTTRYGTFEANHHTIVKGKPLKKACLWIREIAYKPTSISPLELA